MKRPDDLMTALNAFFNSVAENARVVLLALGVVFVIGLAGTVLYNSREAKAGAARDALYTARQLIDKDLTAIAVAEAPPAPKVEPKAKDAKADPKPAAPDAASIAHKKLDVDTRLSAGVGKLKGVVTDYRGTRAAYDASLILGDLYFDHGNATQAVPWYQAAAEQAPASFEKAMALYSLGYAYEGAGKFPEAIQYYEKSMNLGEPGMKGDLLLAMARASSEAHDTAKARTLYDQILSQLPNTEYSRSAELLKGMLEQ